MIKPPTVMVKNADKNKFNLIWTLNFEKKLRKGKKKNRTKIAL